MVTPLVVIPDKEKVRAFLLPATSSEYVVPLIEEWFIDGALEFYRVEDLILPQEIDLFLRTCGFIECASFEEIENKLAFSLILGGFSIGLEVDIVRN